MRFSLFAVRSISFLGRSAFRAAGQIRPALAGPSPALPRPIPCRVPTWGPERPVMAPNHAVGDLDRARDAVPFFYAHLPNPAETGLYAGGQGIGLSANPAVQQIYDPRPLRTGLQFCNCSREPILVVRAADGALAGPPAVRKQSARAICRTGAAWRGFFTRASAAVRNLARAVTWVKPRKKRKLLKRLMIAGQTVT